MLNSKLIIRSSFPVTRSQGYVSPDSVVTCFVLGFARRRVPGRRQSRQILSIVRGDNSSGANSRTARHCPADDDARCATPALSTILYPQTFIDLYCYAIINIWYKHICIVNGSQIGDVTEFYCFIYCVYIRPYITRICFRQCRLW